MKQRAGQNANAKRSGRSSKNRLIKKLVNRFVQLIEPSVEKITIRANVKGAIQNDEVTCQDPLAAEEVAPDKKIKRCYTLTERQIEMLMILKTKIYKNQDLSEIIGIAMESLYDQKISCSSEK